MTIYAVGWGVGGSFMVEIHYVDGPSSEPLDRSSSEA